MASKNATRQIAMPKPLRPCLAARGVQRRPQQSHLYEIVEVTGLQRSVLTVVGETQQLARFRAQALVLAAT